jgi:hypothetical protein
MPRFFPAPPLRKSFVAASFSLCLSAGAAIPFGCVPQVCVDFEPPLVIGTAFGAATGHAPGTVVHTENGIAMSLVEFEDGAGGLNFGDAKSDGTVVPDGAWQSLRLNVVSAAFDFTGLPFLPNRVTVAFLDRGGIENLSANGDKPIVDDLETTTASASGGAMIRIMTTHQPSENWGIAELTGPVKQMQVGGQEFWIDHICAEP